jgi:hypothetical protein
VALALSATLLTGAALAGGARVAAQEGHPLKGSWIGTWGPAKSHSNDLLLILNWDGKAITGMINPGTDDVAIKNATLNPEGWLFRFEADIKEKAGTTLNYVVEGKIESLAFPNRTVSGTWKNQRESGKFKIGRQ